MAKKTSKTADEGQAPGPSGPEIEAGELAAAPFETDAPLHTATEPPRKVASLQGDGEDDAPEFGSRVLLEIPEGAAWREEWIGTACWRDPAQGEACKGPGKCGPCTLRREIKACVAQGMAEPAAPWQSPCGAVANEHEVTIARADVYRDLGLGAVVVEASNGLRWGIRQITSFDVMPRSWRAPKVIPVEPPASAAGE